MLETQATEGVWLRRTADESAKEPPKGSKPDVVTDVAAWRASLKVRTSQHRFPVVVCVPLPARIPAAGW